MADRAYGSGPSASQTGQVMFKGRVLRGREFDEYCEKHGMCTICGKVKVKERKKSSLGLISSWSNIDIKTDDRGQIQVYKGYCIGPSCYTLEQAKSELGEQQDDSVKGKKKKKKQSKKKLQKQNRTETPPVEPWEADFPPNTEGIIDAQVAPAVSKGDDVTQSSGSQGENQARTSGSSAGTGNDSGMESPRSGGMVSNTGAETAPSYASGLAQSDTALSYPHPDRVEPSVLHQSDTALSYDYQRPDRAHSTMTSEMRHDRNHMRSPSLEESGTSASQSTPNLKVPSSRRRRPQEPEGGAYSQVASTLVMPRLPEGGSQESPEETAIQDLEDEVMRQDVHQFLIKMGIYRAKPDVVLRGMELFRDLVFKMHRAEPDRRYIFPHDSWCKTIKSAMSEHPQNLRILEEAAKTIAVMSTFSLRYKSDLLENHVIKDLIAALEAHNSVDEICCIALESLTETSRINIFWREDLVDLTIATLKSLLADPFRGGKEWAILALNNLSSDDKLPEELTGDLMRDAVSDKGVIEALINVMQANVSETVAEAAVSLICRFSGIWKTDDSDFSAETTADYPDEMLGALITVLYSFRSEALHEATCGLLSSIEIPSSTEAEGISWKQTLSDAIWNSLSIHSSVESVQVLALKALCNLFGDPIRREEPVADLDRIVTAIILSMKRYVGNIELQAHACRALACICGEEEFYKRSITRLGGIECIATALRTHVFTDESPAESTPSVDALKEGASAALSCLALSDEAVPVLQDSELLLDFQTILTPSELSRSDGSCIRMCVANLIAVSLIDPDGDMMSDEELSAEVEAGYVLLTKLALQLILQTENEEEVRSLMGSLHLMSCRAHGALDAILSAGKGTGMAHVVNHMQLFPDNESIQEGGCGILANVYFKVPFEGQLGQTFELFVESESFTVTTHTAEEITVVRAALSNHKTKAGVVKNACLALCNFVSGLTVAAADPDDPHLYEHVAEHYAGVTIDADHALGIHEENPEAQKRVFQLLQLAMKLIEPEEMQRCSGTLISKIYEIMIRYPHDEELHASACSVLARFVSANNDSIDASLGNSEGMAALQYSLEAQSEAVVEYATGIISALLLKVFTVSNDIVQMEGYFDALIDCTYRFPDSAPIQAEICSILATIANLSEQFVKTLIANHGGVTAALQVMQSRRGNDHMQECACQALSSMAEGIPTRIMDSVSEPILDELLWALENYSHSAGIQCATLEALCEFCDRDEEFETGLSEANWIPLAVEAMTQNVESKDIQKAGCKLFWTMARLSEENKEKLGQEGAIKAVVVAMMSHVTSTAMQKEALTALKHVSRISCNKQVLKNHDAEGAIRLTIWGNLQEPQVVSAAMSALNDIAVDTETHEVSTVDSEILSCILRAMRQHSSDCDLQRVACWTLRSYTYNEENLSLMRADQQELFELLTAASASFPDDCGDRANQILEKL